MARTEPAANRTEETVEAPDAPAPESSDLPPRLAELDVSRAPPPPIEAPVRIAPLGLARIASIDEDGRVGLQIGTRFVPAKLDGTVHMAVLKTAYERGEPVLIEEEAGAFVIRGALRTQPTPGVDKMSTINLEADTINLKANKEVVVSSGVAAIALRAIGEVETYADRIVSRAESVHKIIGRMLRLN